MSLSLYDVARRPVAVWLHILCRWRINNRIKVMPDGPVILVANHISWIDIPLLGVSIPRRIVFMAKKEYFRSPVHVFIMRIFGSFTVERGVVDRTALKLAQEALKNGAALGIFPEGTRSRTQQLQRGRLGAAYIALQNDAYILPVGISGTEKIKQRYENKRKLLHRPEVTVNIGQPFKLPKADGNPNRAQLASSTQTIMMRLAELLPESYRGVYGDGGTD